MATVELPQYELYVALDPWQAYFLGAAA